MSDSPVAIRAIALSEAVKLGNENVIGMANIFLDFLNGVGDTSTKAVKTERPAKAAKVVEPKVEEAPKGPTRVDVGTAVEKMLGANKRAEAVALMKTFGGATSVGTLKETDYAAFIEKADAILMTA